VLDAPIPEYQRLMKRGSKIPRRTRRAATNHELWPNGEIPYEYDKSMPGKSIHVFL